MPAARADGAQGGQETPDLTELSIEDLMNIEVTSAAKKAEKLSEVAAAVFVITPEDIRRSGVTTIPEALRMVPGLQVARVDANQWAISARGFNEGIANKLLVLIDGRSVYTPMFSGVLWDVQDTLLEDIDRIEVIRGPGGALWGANAVNGVINIITKRASETQGGLLATGGGTEEHGFAGVRYGDALGENGHYRVYAKWFDRDESPGGNDDWRMTRMGFRADWDLGEWDAVTVQGDYYDGRIGERSAVPILTPPFSETFDSDSPVCGGNVLCRWQREFSEDSDLILQLYYDHTERDSVTLRDEVDTVDLDLQHRLPSGSRHDILWGLGYRSIVDDVTLTSAVSLDPVSRDHDLLSAFVQDEITLVEDRLDLTLGSKFEHNDYTGFEVQPSARVAWQPNEREAAWAAISRAVRTPSRIEHDARVNLAVLEVPGAGTGLVSVLPSPDMESEELVAYELGYRTQASDWLFLDVAGFCNRYDSLRTVEPGEPFLELSPSPPHLVLPVSLGNKMSGETHGVELAAQWQPVDWWRVDAAYSYLRMSLHLDADSGDTSSLQAEGQSPRNQFSLRSMMDLPGDLEFDWWLRYVDGLDALDLDSYVGLDLRLGWRPSEDLELSIVGQNLLESHDLQFAPALLLNEATRAERGVYADVTWRF
jgi:iron complex outermembrane receptor protein